MAGAHPAPSACGARPRRWRTRLGESRRAAERAALPCACALPPRLGRLAGAAGGDPLARREAPGPGPGPAAHHVEASAEQRGLRRLQRPG